MIKAVLPIGIPAYKGKDYLEGCMGSMETGRLMTQMFICILHINGIFFSDGPLNFEMHGNYPQIHTNV